MYQAGVKNITLYENKGISFRYYDLFDSSQITELVTLGDVILLENINRPKYEINSKFTNSGRLANSYKIDFILYGLLTDNINLIEQLANSIYGWCFLVELYSGEFLFYNVPVVCRANKIKPHDEMSYSVTLETTVPTFKTHLNYTAGVSGIPVYRFDTELLTFDSEIYSFDYEL
jgi:hypothetical protein